MVRILCAIRVAIVHLANIIMDSVCYNLWILCAIIGLVHFTFTFKMDITVSIHGCSLSRNNVNAHGMHGIREAPLKYYIIASYIHQ